MGKSGIASIIIQNVSNNFLSIFSLILDSSKMVEVLRDKEFLVKEYLETRGLYSHHINSFNAFIDRDLKKIVQQNHAVRSDADPNFYLHFKNVSVGHPQV